MNSYKKTLRKWIIETRPELRHEDVRSQQTEDAGQGPLQTTRGPPDATGLPDTDAV